MGKETAQPGDLQYWDAHTEGWFVAPIIAEESRYNRALVKYWEGLQDDKDTLLLQKPCRGGVDSALTWNGAGQ